MNPVALHLASGTSAFSGAALLILGVSVSPWCKGRWVKSLRTVLAWLGLALMLASATPWPRWLSFLFGVAFLGWFLAEDVERVRRIIRSVPPRAALIGVVALMAAMELPYTFPPKIPPARGRHVYVIGDSISADIGSGYPPWPDVLATRHALPVTNLALAGATIVDAIPMAVQVKTRNAVVLVEIGGNDLLSGLPLRDFERHLDALLAFLQEPGRTIVMLELPLFPFYDGYGRAQRTLARKYRVSLVPKRYIARVLGAPGATADGLHLSESGTQLMADTVYSILGSALSGLE